MNPFEKFPALRVFLRLCLPAGVLGVAAILTVSLLAPFLVPEPAPFADRTRNALFFYGRVIDYTFHPPQICRPEYDRSDFEESQCRQFKERLQLSLAVAAVPIFLVFLFFAITFPRIESAYRRASHILSVASSAHRGIARRDAPIRYDRFCWFYGVRPLSVQVRDGSLIVVYFSEDATLPLDGQEVAFFKWLRAFGEERRIGLIHTPHAKVFRGEA